MDIEQLSSQVANVYDDNSFIRVDHSRREQPTDNQRSSYVSQINFDLKVDLIDLIDVLSL
jgi:hypothetical protein